MADVSVPRVAMIAMFVLSFIFTTYNTVFGQFLLWFPFGWGWIAWLVEFIVAWYEYLASVLMIFVALKWTKNAYILMIIAILFFLFLKFGLKSVVGT